MKHLLLLFLLVPAISFAQKPAKSPSKPKTRKTASKPKANSTPTDGNDKKAEKILDDVSKKYKSLKSFQAKFTYTLENKADNIKETQTGTITTSGHKFKVEMPARRFIAMAKPCIPTTTKRMKFPLVTILRRMPM